MSDEREKLPENSSLISISDGEELAKIIKAEKFIECSAFTRENVEKVFEEAAKIAMIMRRERRELKPSNCREQQGCKLL
jgi:hypothetical protein